MLLIFWLPAGAAGDLKKLKPLLDFSNFLGNPNLDLVMNYIFRKPEE